jgi:uncharacterized Ntn-hydrolase superfamily protein
MKITVLLAALSLIAGRLSSQDTFSIVAADSLSREVGSAGASCVDLFQFGIADASFLGDLLPDTGAINTQASYLAANQNNARARMRAGDQPAQIISWLTANDVGGNSAVRQYGITGFTGTAVAAAAHTGASCLNYKNHITGNIGGIYYSIQGNILLGQNVLDSMESRFRKAQGDLACRLMAALQGAKMVGADTRCASNNTSSLFAFIKVAQPSDPYGSPSFKLTVKTANNDSIEPIDSLQTLFSTQHSCLVAAIRENGKAAFTVWPSPAHDELKVSAGISLNGMSFRISNLQGQLLLAGTLSETKIAIGVGELARGFYFLEISGLGHVKFLRQ